MKNISTILATAMTAIALSACNDSALEEGAEKVDSAMESSAEAVNETMTDVGNAVEDSCEKVKTELEMEDRDC